MELSKSKSDLLCIIRKKWVENTPEERIRQALIKKMIEELGYLPAYISVEKELSQLPHLKCEPLPLPKRRIDLLVFSKDPRKKDLFPLLMVECKAVAITPKVARQVIGYNAFVKAPFLAIANETQILTGHFEEKEGHFQFKEGLPSYGCLEGIRAP